MSALTRRILLVVAAVMLLAGLKPCATAARPAGPELAGTVPAAPARPALVVLLVIDQMRSDYIELFGGEWRGGLRRLVERGALFTEAAYPYLGTATCPGHATISTGSHPARHGFIQNRWWDRQAKRRVTCTEDPAVRAIGYGRPARTAHTAHALEVSTLAEELTRQGGGQGRAVVVSLKPRSAVALAGRRGDVVLWFDRTAGTWATSSAYTDAPVPLVAAFIDANPLERELAKVWNRLRPAAAYRYPDEGAGERPRYGRSPTFPHVLQPENGSADASPYYLWEQSPYSDEYLARMAAALVERMALGRGPATDFLGISFSALDEAGHAFGPESQEIQDLLLWLDRTLDRLFTDLDRLVGPDRYVVAVSSDHGVAPIPERRRHEGLDGGRVDLQDLNARLEAALDRQLGAGRHLAAVVHTNVYLADGSYERLIARPGALAAVRAAAEETPGVGRLFTRDELERGATSEDTALRAASLSHFPGRGGDLAFVPEPYWSTSSDPATHGTAYDYDTRVPVLFMGSGIKPGRYREAATPADIAPTLAHLCGVDLGARDGRVLDAALDPL